MIKKKIKKLKNLKLHPYYRATEDALLGTGKKISDDSKKLKKGSPFYTIKKKKKKKKLQAEQIRRAVYGSGSFF